MEVQDLKGYLKLFRSVLFHPVAEEKDSVFTSFIKILLSVNRHTGTCTTSISELQQFLQHGSKNTTYDCLDRLSALEIIRVSYGRNLKIAFINWNKYQRGKDFQSLCAPVQKIDRNGSKNELQSSKTEQNKPSTEILNSSKIELIRSKSELNRSKNELQSSKTEQKHKEVRAREEKENGKIKNKTDMRASFEIWWKEYPRKQAKKPALRVWLKNKPDLQILLKALRWQKKSEMWTKDGGRYIPFPTTYLNQERWADEPQIKITEGKNYGGKNYDTEKKDYQHLFDVQTDGD